MINWQDKNSLRRRGNKDVRAVDVHEVPKWVDPTYWSWARLYEGYRFWVLWSDGVTCSYSLDGVHNKSAENLDNDVIPAPRSGEGWMRNYAGHDDRFVIEPEREWNEEYTRVRWEEIE